MNNKYAEPAWYDFITAELIYVADLQSLIFDL